MPQQFSTKGCVVLAASVLAASAVATDIYFVENSPTVPGDTNFWKTDTDAKTATKLATLDKTGVIDVVSGAVVCGNTYLGCWDTFPSNYGLLKVDISAPNYTHIFMEGDYLLHAVGCDPADQTKAFVVGSTPEADTSAQFSLISFDLATANQTKIADFPDVKGAEFEGMDAEFRFDADGKTATMVMGKKGVGAEPVSSYIYTMDTSSGSLTGSYVTRLHALDTVFDGLKRGVTLDTNQDKYQLNWADISCSDKSCFVKVTGNAQDDWDAGKPFAVCDDDAWVAQSLAGPTRPLKQSSISKGGSVEVVDLSTQGVKGEAGGLAAVCSK